MAELKDSGNRREFESGAVRDMQEGKGRMDLIPWGIALQIRETMTDLFGGYHHGYTIENGHYKAVDVKTCVGPIVEYADWMDDVLNNENRIDGVNRIPFKRLCEIKNTFIRMAAVFIMFQDGSYDDVQTDEIGMISLILNQKWSSAMLEVAKHYEDGARKYAENNWRKGMDPKIYFDSAMRHFMKWVYGMQDEPHDRAFIWNCMCGAWEAEQERKLIGKTLKRVQQCVMPDSMNVVQSTSPSFVPPQS